MNCAKDARSVSEHFHDFLLFYREYVQVGERMQNKGVDEGLRMSSWMIINDVFLCIFSWRYYNGSRERSILLG